MAGASQQLAEFVESTGFQDLPEDVVVKTKDLILDHLGVCIFGSTLPWSQIVADLVTGDGTTGDCSVHLTGRKSSPRNAALANGTMAHAFELDDTLRPFHPGSVVIPAALAIAEHRRSCGKEFIAAIVLGYEVMSRVGSAIHDTRIFGTGHHGTGVIGSIGAAVAAGKLLGLDGKQLGCAMGLAANQQTGLMEFFKDGTMEKRLFSGKASHDGVLSAMLAARGYTAASGSIDGEYGFCRVFDPGADLLSLTQELGGTFKLLDTEVKPYPCCRAIHLPVDCAIAAAKKHDISPGEIKEVAVYGNKSQASDQHAFYEIPDVMAAQYSIPYCTAKAFLRRQVWVDDFTPLAIRDEKTLSLMSKVRVIFDSGIADHRGEARISVRMADGRTIIETVDCGTGSPESPSFRGDLSNKFSMLSSSVVSEAKAEQIMDLVESLEEISDMTELGGVLLRGE